MKPHDYRQKHFGRKWQDMTEEDKQNLRRRGGRMFARLLAVFGMIVLLILGGMLGLAFLFTRLAGGDGEVAFYVWIAGILALFMLPISAVYLSLRAFRDIAFPLSEVIGAADAVSKGDLSVRVNSDRTGEFGGLARAFNHMVTELEMADIRRRNLTADVAHELRTPLHIIQGNLEGVLDQVYEPDAEHIEATLDETRILSRLVEDLRVLSLAEGGQLQTRKETIDVTEFLDDVVTSFSGQASAAGIELESETVSVPQIEADHDRMTQVINNLVSNSLRHTAEGGSIQLKAKSKDDKVLITVSDTGEGISADQLPHVFDRFWRGDKSRAHTGSTGLGLAIARQLVLAQGGDISVESKEGVGTTFTIAI